MQEYRTYKISEDSYLQISDDILYNGETFKSQSSYRQAIPFSNSDFMALTDEHGRMELLQSPIFSKAFENCSHIRYVKQQIRDTDRPQREKTDADCYVDIINQLVNVLASLRSDVQ